MSWQIKGQYMETCSCDYVCPCPLTGLAETTHGYCTFAMAFRVDNGKFDDVALGDTKFVIVGHTPGNMGAGNWQVGLIVDETTDAKQREALGAIVSGQAGGPMANLAPLISEFKGVEAQPIEFSGEGASWTVKAGPAIDQAVEGVQGLGGEYLALDGTGHPVNTRLNLAHATRSSIHAFGIDYQESSGQNNGHFAPFDWRG